MSKIPFIIWLLIVGVMGNIVMGMGFVVGALDEQVVPNRPPTCERSIFPAEVLRTIDGDTIEVMVGLGLDTFRQTAVRLVGIDTPEVFGPKVKRDPVRGPAATEFTKAWVAAHNAHVELFVHGDDKYGGRIDADVYPAGGGQRLSDALREAGLEK